jgi:hypothetical protein
MSSRAASKSSTRQQESEDCRQQWDTTAAGGDAGTRRCGDPVRNESTHSKGAPGQMKRLATTAIGALLVVPAARIYAIR